jgi:hypothetical protein
VVVELEKQVEMVDKELLLLEVKGGMDLPT